MEKIVHLSLATRDVITKIDVVQLSTKPDIVFVIDDYKPSGMASLYIKKPDGTSVYNPCIIRDNKIIYSPTLQSFSVKGLSECQLQIISDKGTPYSFIIHANVTPNVIDAKSIVSTDEFARLEETLRSAEQYENVIGGNNLTGANNKEYWTTLTSNQDLNSVTEVGVYTCPDSEICRTLIHKPSVDSEFKMIVEVSGDDISKLKQTVIDTISLKTYTRCTIDDGASWTDWYRQPDNEDLSSLLYHGTKNILACTALKNGSVTNNGITYTQGENGAIIANGTATSNSFLSLDGYNSTYADGREYILSGCPIVSGYGSVSLRIYEYPNTVLVSDTGNGAKFTTVPGHRYSAYIVISSGTRVDNIVFYPMIRDASIDDNRYIGYAMDNRELTTALTSSNYVNVASMLGTEELSNDNIVTAITSALRLSDYIYIPAGKFEFNLTLTDRTCHILLDKNCYISTPNEDPCIMATNCSIEMSGGNVYAGVDDDSRIPIYGNGESVGHSFRSIIRLENCNNSRFNGIITPYSKYCCVYQVKNCTNIIFENLELYNFLMCGIRILEWNRNVIVCNCKFANIDRIMDSSAVYDYCYAVCTGGMSESSTFTPPVGIVYENNFVVDSEDCALDCHGGTDIIIRNNKIYDTVNAITAYNDNSRITRPIDIETGERWTMKNVLIENNYCISEKDNEEGRLLNHAFIFLGASNDRKDTDPQGSNNPGSYNAYCGCTVRNNYFKSKNTYGMGLINMNAVSRNVIIENNVIDCCDVARPATFFRSIDFIFRNNTILNQPKNTNEKQYDIYCESSFGEIKNNIGARFNVSVSKPSRIIGLLGNIVESVRSSFIGTGDYIFINDTLHICTNYGVRLRNDLNLLDFQITVEDNGVAVTDDNIMIPQVALSLNGSSVNYYVKDVIDMRRFILIDASGNFVSPGTYTASVRKATTSAV